LVDGVGLEETAFRAGRHLHVGGWFTCSSGKWPWCISK
jgi:hypothetical protein